MTKFFCIYHGLVASAPWGIAVERRSAKAGDQGKMEPKLELLLLCRTEKEAREHAEKAMLGTWVQEFCDKETRAEAGCEAHRFIMLKAI
jgi:hypothetical protein